MGSLPFSLQGPVYSEFTLEILTVVACATMKRVGGMIIFVVTFTAALLQLSDAADAESVPEQRTEGELLNCRRQQERFCWKE